MGVIVDVVGSLAAHVPGKEALLGETEVFNASLRSVEDSFWQLANNRIVLYSVGAFAVYKAWRVLFSPLQHIRRNPDVGYISDGVQHKLERANEVRRRRQTGDLPPVYPNGWYCIMPAHELPIKGAS